MTEKEIKEYIDRKIKEIKKETECDDCILVIGKDGKGEMRIGINNEETLVVCANQVIKAYGELGKNPCRRQTCLLRELTKHLISEIKEEFGEKELSPEIDDMIPKETEDDPPAEEDMVKESPKEGSRRQKMIRLSRNKRYKLFEIVRIRDRDLWDVYERMLGIPYPAGRNHVHHVIPVASGGEDIAENLITLDPKTHFYIFHNGFGSVDKEWQRIAKKYLESKEVKAWHEEREASLTALYQTAETTRIKKIRKNCLPEKRPGFKY